MSFDISELTEKDIKRFWSKVDIRGEDECWKWMGCKTKRGEGLFFAPNGAHLRASHIIYYIYYRYQKAGIAIGHMCDNLDCCNPKHLFIKKKDVDKKWEIDEKFLKRFWNKVEVKNHDECWEWLGSCDAKGYGTFNANYHSIRAHRVSYMIKNGRHSIPEGMSICHRCDNRKCVNDKHLFLGTNYDNVQDRHKKGRSGSAKGENHGGSKLKNEDVVYIRNSFAKKEKSKKELAKMFNMSMSMIKGIIRGSYWKDSGGKITKVEINRLSVDEVKNIRYNLLKTDIPRKDIAEKYGVSISTIANIENKKAWRNI